MAAIKIAQLTSQLTLSDTDTVIVESATSTNKMTVGKLKELFGIQAGGVVESGSNSNGSYIKYGNGIMECWHTISNEANIPNALVGGFRSAGYTWTYPQEFLVGTVVNPQGTPVNLAAFSIVITGPYHHSLTYVYTAPTTQPTTLRMASLYAIGRWK